MAGRQAIEEERHLHNLSWLDFFERLCRRNVLQAIGPDHLEAARGYVTFMEFLYTLEADANANIDSTSVAYARAQWARDPRAGIEAKSAVGRTGK